MKTSIQIEVRPTEIDVLGHVNNAKYLEYMEWSREDWYQRSGLPFARLVEMEIGTVIVKVEIQYRKEVKLGEKLTISTEPICKGRTSFVLRHEIHNEANELVTEAEAVGVTIDLKARKSVPLPDELERQFVRG